MQIKNVLTILTVAMFAHVQAVPLVDNSASDLPPNAIPDIVKGYIDGLLHINLQG